MDDWYNLDKIIRLEFVHNRLYGLIFITLSLFVDSSLSKTSLTNHRHFAQIVRWEDISINCMHFLNFLSPLQKSRLNEKGLYRIIGKPSVLLIFQFKILIFKNLNLSISFHEGMNGSNVRLDLRQFITFGKKITFSFHNT